jgi:SNF family Na+-dependent transporter
MLTAVFIGWIWGTKRAEEEIEKHETTFHWAHVWGFLIRYITPVAVLFIFLARFLK